MPLRYSEQGEFGSSVPRLSAALTHAVERRKEASNKVASEERRLRDVVIMMEQQACPVFPFSQAELQVLLRSKPALFLCSTEALKRPCPQ